MKIARKLSLTLFPAIFVVHAALAVGWIGQEVLAMREDLLRDHEMLARELRTVTSRAYAAEGDAGVTDALRDAARAEGKLRIQRATITSASADGAPTAAIDALRSGHDAQWFDARRSRFVTWIPVANSPDLVVEMSESLREEIGHLRKLALEIGLVAAILAAIQTAIVYAIGKAQIGSPVDRLIAKTGRIAGGDYTRPVALVETGEIGALGQAIDAMAVALEASRSALAAETTARLATVDQLKHAERLATVGTLASGVAHELGTPLNVVIARAKLITTDEAAPAELREAAGIIAEQGLRMTTIIRGMLDFARQNTPTVGRVDLVTLVSHARDLLAPLARRRRVTVIVEASPVTSVIGDSEQLMQVVTNLIVNAVQASPEGGTVRVAVAHERRRGPADVPGESWARVAVSDEGAGVAPEVVARVFEPFFTTKDVGEGTGLGLAISWGIAREHHGFIDVDGTPGRCTFALYLPWEAP